MKTSCPNSRWNPFRRTEQCLAWALVVTALCCGMPFPAGAEKAQTPGAKPPADTPGAPPDPASVSVDTTTPSVQVAPDAILSPSPAVQAVLRMTEAGVSLEVIKTYVECSASVDPLTDADIIALKQHDVADGIVTALMTQGAKRRALEDQRKNELAARALAARDRHLGGLDPESYEYFQYYYLQPRASASAYQRLSPYLGPRNYYYYGPSPNYRFRHRDYRGPRFP